MSKYDAGGSLQWTRQLGTANIDLSNSVSTDGMGNVYLSGKTYGSLGGVNAGLDDAFVSKYDTAGVLQWTQQLGTAIQDESFGVSADGKGNVYLSGMTRGSLGWANEGGVDAFVAKFGIPEPATSTMLTVVLALLSLKRDRS